MNVKQMRIDLERGVKHWAQHGRNKLSGEVVDKAVMRECFNSITMYANKVLEELENEVPEPPPPPGSTLSVKAILPTEGQWIPHGEGYTQLLWTGTEWDTHDSFDLNGHGIMIKQAGLHLVILRADFEFEGENPSYSYEFRVLLNGSYKSIAYHWHDHPGYQHLTVVDPMILKIGDVLTTDCMQYSGEDKKVTGDPAATSFTIHQLLQGV